MGALLALLQFTPQGLTAVAIRWGAIALLLIAFGGFCWTKGAGHVQHRWDEHTASIEKAHDAEVSRLEMIKAKVEVQYVERLKYIRVAGQNIIKEVPTYVTAHDDAACTIPPGFVSLLNRAAQGLSSP